MLSAELADEVGCREEGDGDEHRATEDGEGGGNEEGASAKQGAQNHHLLPENWLHNQGLSLQAVKVEVAQDTS